MEREERDAEVVDLGSAYVETRGSGQQLRDEPDQRNIMFGMTDD